MSVFAILDGEGVVKDARIERTLVRSRHKLSYEQAQSVLDGELSIDTATDEALADLAGLSRVLRARREERGALDFDLPEARVVLGESGRPIEIQRVERLDSHRLVEDFMLLANEIIARRAEDAGLPVMYRVHESPPRDKMLELKSFLTRLGLKTSKGAVGPKELQTLLVKVQGSPEGRLVSTVVLRAMSRARYDPRNLGHFGLAATHYTHFTSPIRRYPDLWLHRVLCQALIEDRPIPEEWGGDELEAMGMRCSTQERVAEAAERESVDLKKAEYMERHLGDEFTGTISGVTSFGLFVLLDEVFVEGLVHVNSMMDDYYAFQEDSYRLVGERSRRTFRLGDRLAVRVSRVDKLERFIDFVLVDAGSVRR
jgi:ribonuclease R